VVVVYKVDRLTRSLADFAKLVELFDEHQVSFVSVTQAFNTTSSMGRLTLNVLLSFAQFEREVTGERIRDKIAASKRKGLWMGGTLPLGYRIQDRKLVMDEAEAETVRFIFRRYLELQSLTALISELTERGIRTKERPLTSGAARGGIPFSVGPLAYLLKNRTYLGEIVHRGERHRGEHEPIVAEDMFAAVQDQLASRKRGRHNLLASSSALAGRIFDDRGHRMTPTHASKGGARYRYYVSCPVLQGRGDEAGAVRRVSAPDVEAAVIKALRAHGPELEEFSDAELIEQRLERVVVREAELQITFVADDSSTSTVTVLWSAPRHYRKREIISRPGDEASDDLRMRPLRAERRAKLIEGIAKARGWIQEMTSGKVSSTAAIAERESCSERSVRITLNLAFLSPAIVQAAVDGTLPRGAGLTSLAELPMSWAGQHRALRGLIA
jgi:hypothetical protein